MIPLTGRTLAQHVRCSSNPIRSFRTVANSLDQRRSHLVTVFRNGRWVRIPGENLYLNRYRGTLEPEAYVTQSTTPVASSFQQVEPDLQGGTRTANRTPAEVPNADASVPVDGGGSGKEGEKIGGATESLLKKQVIEGVEMPVKPPAPASDECCMSGCARCVYDIYAEDLKLYYDELTVARQALLQKGVPSSKWPTELAGSASSGPSTRSTAETADAEVEMEIEGLDPSMQAFLSFERALKKKRAAT